MSQHICIISCQHPPDDVRVTHKLGMSLRHAGFRVTWIGPQRDYRGQNYGIEFKYYPRDRGHLTRLYNHRKAKGLAAKLDDVDVFLGVEPDSAMVAACIARQRSAHAVFDIHEVYHDEMLGRWATGLFRTVLGFLLIQKMRRICRSCDLVLGVSDVVLQPYRSLCENVLVVRNCAPISFAAGPIADVCGPNRCQFTISHGKSTLAHGTVPVVSALGLAAKEIPGLKLIVFDAFGEHPESFDRQFFESLVVRSQTKGLIDLRRQVPMGDMMDILRSCDVGIVAYNRTWGVRSLPNKLFEYMALGLPVIAPSYSVEIRKVVEAEGCGLLVDCENPVEIAQAIRHLHRNPVEARKMGERGRDAFIRRHNWSVEVGPLIAILKRWCQCSAT